MTSRKNDVMQRDALQFTALQKFSNDGQPKDIIMSKAYTFQINLSKQF